jgi:Holliday junction resolvase-like predicted endonuclease
MFVSTTQIRHPRRQGDLGELAAMEYLASTGAAVLVPLFHSPDYDLVADYGDRFVRVQVKTATFVRRARFEVQVKTTGGNRSWNGLVKRFEARRCDFLFVLVSGGRRWFIPSSAVDGGTEILLGGPKYHPYELQPTTDYLAALDSESVPRGSARAVKGSAL